MEIVEHDFRLGDPWGLCLRCGQQFRLKSMRREWSGLTRVCDDCWDPLPDTMHPPSSGPEGLPYPDPSPDQPAVFIQNQVRPEDL